MFSECSLLLSEYSTIGLDEILGMEEVTMGKQEMITQMMRDYGVKGEDYFDRTL
ncbi:hypothetical protein SAMN05444972_11815 [Marininema halotolerans]|uniref:Uncharacterized protein n=1 Tax=Marininema halotolerans TaxID=1155944 RepID=A0A1I6ULY4_9BACL|nr:hypothetical protein SAMN05444972_11815 [Marininema halotolerans]